ncbi:MAG: TetR/AcrR family transcriptional regulator [Actinomycetota bacterium]|nr:TetR/AcrR family transcriptional regulator [Actinomycetota bacterium]
MSGSPNSVQPKDRPTTRQAARRAATRDEIVDAAWQLCREEGLAGLSLRELARRVGLAAPSVYSYFASKDAIYDEMFRQGQVQLGEMMAEHVEADVAGGRAVARRAARSFFDFCTADPVRYQLLFQRTIPGFVPSPQSYALAVAQLEALARQMRAFGLHDARAVDLWTAVLTGLTDQQISNDPGGTRWASLVDDAVDMLCDHLGLPADPPATTARRNR